MSDVILKNGFTDGMAMAKRYPATFEVPTLMEKSMIKVGDFVKVGHNQEKFWCEVKFINGNDIRAEVNNDLVNDHPFECGDDIHFEMDHVLAIY